MSSKSLRQSSVLSRVVKCLMAHPEMLKSFWHNHIDQVPTSSFKTSVKFSLLDLIIVNATDHDSIPQFLTKNVICTIIQVLSKVETTTEEEAIILTVLESVISVATEHKQIQRPVLKSLLQSPGKITFDKITGMK